MATEVIYGGTESELPELVIPHYVTGDSGLYTFTERESARWADEPCERCEADIYPVYTNFTYSASPTDSSAAQDVVDGVAIKHQVIVVGLVGLKCGCDGLESVAPAHLPEGTQDRVRDLVAQEAVPMGLHLEDLPPLVVVRGEVTRSTIAEIRRAPLMR